MTRSVRGARAKIHFAIITLLAWATTGTGTAPAQTVTLNFGELPTQPVDGLSFMGVTFGFTVNGVPSSDATYNALLGPGSIAHVQSPNMEGDAFGVLTMDFDTPTSTLQFGVALNDTDPHSPGFTVELYDASFNLFNTVAVSTLPLVLYSEAQYSFVGQPVKRARISFAHPFFDSRFALDNLEYQSSTGCVSSISPTSMFFGEGGGSGTIGVTAASNCNWSATTGASFITITSGASGTGNGTVGYTVASNNTLSSRNGTIIIGGRPFAVDQAPGSASSTLRLSSSTVDVTGITGGGTRMTAVEVISDSPVGFTAVARELNGQSWLGVSPTSGVTASTGIATQSTNGAALASNTLTISVNFSALAPGLYQGIVEVTSGSTTQKLQVRASVSTTQSRLVTSPQSIVFTAAEGGFQPRSHTLKIANIGQANLQWSLSENPAASWLSASPTAGTAAAGGLSTTTLTANTTGLSAGVYQTRLAVTAPGAGNSPQLITVTLHVVPAGTPPKMELSPSAMIFVTQVGAAPLPAQTMTVSNVGAGGVTFNLGTSTSSGGNWLGISQASGSTAIGPAPIGTSTNAASLTAGIYRGKVTVTPSSGPAQEMEVVLVVAPAGTFLQRELPGAAACGALSLDLVGTTIGNGLSLPVSFPRPLLAQVVDNCGAPVDDATVVATIDQLSIEMGSVGGGQYSGTWTPTAESAAVAVALAATHPTLGTAQRNYTVSTSAAAGGVALPVAAPNGVVEGAGFTPQRPLAPGSIVSIFGTGFASGNNNALSVPLERSLGGTSVRIGSEDAPLYFVGPGQINAQVPFTAAAGESVSIVVNANGRLTAPQTYLIAAAQPGIFNGAVLDFQNNPASGGLPVTAANPARIGHDLIIYSGGLGLVETPVGTGEASPAARALLPVTVTIGGVEVPVAYAGLTPGYVGLYQVNVNLTGNVPTGDNLPVVLQQNGIESNPVLPILISIRP